MAVESCVAHTTHLPLAICQALHDKDGNLVEGKSLASGSFVKLVTSKDQTILAIQLVADRTIALGVYVFQKRFITECSTEFLGLAKPADNLPGELRELMKPHLVTPIEAEVRDQVTSFMVGQILDQLKIFNIRG